MAGGVQPATHPHRSRETPMHVQRSTYAIAALGLAATTGLLVLTSGGAEASYAGSNGRLAFGVSYGSGQPDVYSVLSNGRRVRQLTSDPAFQAWPSYSVDGRYVAYCSAAGNGSGGLDIWIMKQNGTSQRRVTNLGGNVTFPDFSPTGEQLVFAGRPGGAAGIDVYTIGVDGLGLTQLTTASSVDRMPVFSPDGEHIAFLSNRSGMFQVWIMNADGTD